MKRAISLVVAGALASALSRSLDAATSPAPGQGDARLHLEGCTKWAELNGSFGFTNECGEPVALLFIQLDGAHRFDRLIQPNQRFDTGVREKAINSSGWLYTVCPAGYVPSLPFTAEHQIQISTGQYECVRR